MSSSQQQYTTAFIDTQDALGSLASSEFAIDGFSMSDYAAASSSFMAPSSGALVPVSVPALNSYTVPGQLQTTDWPLRLPDRQTTRHLVHAFFAFHTQAGRLFHGPTFLASLELPPADPRFPFDAVLHAMCAVGSLYTAAIPQAPIQPRARRAGAPSASPFAWADDSGEDAGSGQFLAFDELFPGRWRKYERRPDSFAELQAAFAKRTAEESIDRGERLLECLQTNVILVWFYLYQARWSEAYLTSGFAMRCVIPCGLNMSTLLPPNMMPLPNYSEKPPSILGNEQSFIDREVRRNTFWIAYSLERQGASGTNYAMALDDHDVLQVLPLRGDKFEGAVPVPQEERQWAYDKSMFLHHPPMQTDSFVLFIKAMILLSHVKTFIIRIRGMTMTFSLTANGVQQGSIPSDVWASPGFQELDSLLLSFPSSLPSYYRQPIQDQTVDTYMLGALNAVYMAQIMLHEPHARMGAAGDVSANRLVRAARAVLQLAYGLGSTSYDLALLDPLPIVRAPLSARGVVLTRRAGGSWRGTAARGC